MKGYVRSVKQWSPGYSQLVIMPAHPVIA